MGKTKEHWKMKKTMQRGEVAARGDPRQEYLCFPDSQVSGGSVLHFFLLNSLLNRWRKKIDEESEL